MERPPGGSFEELKPIPWERVFASWHAQQRGGGQSQTGRGLGEFLLGLRYAIPLFLNSVVGRELFGATRDIATDVEGGEPFVRSFRRRSRKAFRNLTGLGKKRQKRRAKRPVAISISRASGERRSPLFLKAGANSTGK